MMPWTDDDTRRSAADAYRSMRGLGAALLIASAIYLPLVLAAIVGIGLHQGWW